MKKIAILGAGLCGLAAATYLTARKEASDITLFDPAPLGQNTSGLAAGLLHPFPGAHAKHPPHGFEGIKATLELVKIAEESLGEQIAEKSGLLRVAVTEEQKIDFRLCSTKYPGVVWMEKEQCLELIPCLHPNPGIFVEDSWVIQSQQYLKGLWLHCKSCGVKWDPSKVESLDQLKSFDTIIVSAGGAAKSIHELSQLAIKPVKGQLLVIKWPETIPPLAHPLNSQAYMVMSPDKTMCYVGATFERGFESAQPDFEVAKANLFPKVLDLIPAMKDVPILECRAGLRASTPTNQPIIEQVTKNCWAFGGMGSKGLIYHALFAKKLIDRINH